MAPSPFDFYIDIPASMAKAPFQFTLPSDVARLLGLRKNNLPIRFDIVPFSACEIYFRRQTGRGGGWRGYRADTEVFMSHAPISEGDRVFFTRIPQLQTSSFHVYRVTSESMENLILDMKHKGTYGLDQVFFGPSSAPSVVAARNK